MNKSTNTLIVVMGVSGCGKSSVASALANDLSYEFIEADDFHSEKNTAHMASGKPLTDEMRKPWVKALCSQIQLIHQKGQNCVMSFSGLKHHHREQIRQAAKHAIFIHLHGEQMIIHNRMLARKDHFMPAKLLDSQYQALEMPDNEPHTHLVDIDNSLEHIIDTSLNIIKQNEK